MANENENAIEASNFKNPRYAIVDNTFIDMELDHPDFGWIPITISAEDYPDLWSRVTADHVEPFEETTEADQRAEWRKTAFLSRASFCMALRKQNILPADQAIAASKGDWPTNFTALLAAMPDGMDPDEAQIIWAGITLVERLHPLFEAVRQFHGMPEEDADALFGYQE